MRTEEILATIDHALEDWAVSGDAMRWTPEPETAEGSPALSDGPLRWQPTLVSASVEHRPGCSIVHEYLNAPPACQCGALDRAARRLRLPASALSVAPAGTAPGAGEWTDLSRLVDCITFNPGPWQAAVLAQTYGSAFRDAAEAVSRAMHAGPDEVDRLQAAMEELGSLAPERAEQEDPRARALRLRRHRNTGPASDVTRQRRPRHHLSAGSSTRTARR